MAAGRLLNLPDHLQLSSGNVSQNWKRFKQKWSNYKLVIGTARKEDPIRVATFLTVIGDQALDVYNALTWDSDKDKVTMDKVLEHFEQYCEPCKNTIYERYLFFSRRQESGEPIEKYATVLQNMADSSELQDTPGWRAQKFGHFEGEIFYPRWRRAPYLIFSNLYQFIREQFIVFR